MISLMAEYWHWLLPALAAIAALAAFAILTKDWRLGAAGAALLMAALQVARVFQAGRAAKEREVDKANARARDIRAKEDDAVNRSPVDRNREELRRWGK